VSRRIFHISRLHVAMLSLCSAAAAMAAPLSDGKAADSMHTTVTLSDLDVTTAAGYSEAVQRISAVAHRLCNRLHGSSRVDDRESAAQCIRTAIADASARLPQFVGDEGVSPGR
jgi:UrcA family protein